MAWERVQRANGQASSGSFITLRKTAIGFNAEFIRQNQLDKKNRVTIHADEQARKLGFEFHDDPSDFDSLALTQDGGQQRRDQPGSRTYGRVVQANALMQRPWLKRAVSNQLRTRFVPQKDGRFWVISIGPAFESQAQVPSDIPSGATGIYRYRSDGDVVYIGRGAIRQRMQDAARDDWSFSAVEYTVLNDAEAEAEWETKFIEEFKQQFDRRPKYNRVSGRQSRKPD